MCPAAPSTHMSDYGPSFSSCPPRPPRRAWRLGLRLKQNHFNNFQQKVKTGKLVPTGFLGNLPVGCGCPGSSGLSLHLDILATGAPSPVPIPAWLPLPVGRTCPQQSCGGDAAAPVGVPWCRPWGWALAAWVCGAQPSWCWGLGSRDQALSRPHFLQGQLSSLWLSSPTRT